MEFKVGFFCVGAKTGFLLGLPSRCFLSVLHLTALGTLSQGAHSYLQLLQRTSEVKPTKATLKALLSFLTRGLRTRHTHTCSCVSPTQGNGNERLSLWLLLHNARHPPVKAFSSFKMPWRLPPLLNPPPCWTLTQIVHSKHMSYKATYSSPLPHPHSLSPLEYISQPQVPGLSCF